MKLKKPKESKITMEEFTKLCAEPINWEQRRYEVAKAMMPVIYSKYWDENDDGYAEMVDSHSDDIDENGFYYTHDEFVAKESIYLADILIKFLKL